MWLLSACAALDEDGEILASRPEESDADADADADGDSDADSDTDSVTDPFPDEETGCETFGGVRARCAMATLADWVNGEYDGAEHDDRVTLKDDGLTAGTDTTGAYNGGDYWYGSVVTPELTPGIPFDAFVPSWNATTPAGTWISVQAQARIDDTWTAWYRLGVWASGETDVTRHSFDGEADAYGTVYTDTVFLDAPADAVRLRATLFTADGVAKPILTRLAVAFADSGARGVDAGGEAWGVALDVPARSQMVFDEGEAWCSPTSTSMILAYWGVDVSVPDAADGTWDDVYGGNGNWPFNVAYAASLGLSGEVGWFGEVSELEPWIAAGAPVAISAAWDRGEVDGAPISSTAGHLLVVTGFTADGDVRVNDPAAASDAEVSRTYDRRQFAEAWLGGSGGVAYLLWPGETRPVD